MRVQCAAITADRKGRVGCGHSWQFKSRVPGFKLKHNYDVRCPKCGRVVFTRKVTKLRRGRDNQEATH